MAIDDDDGYQDLTALISNPLLFTSQLAKQIKTTSTEVGGGGGGGSLPSGDIGQFLAINGVGDHEFVNIEQGDVAGLQDALAALGGGGGGTFAGLTDLTSSTVNTPIDIISAHVSNGQYSEIGLDGTVEAPSATIRVFNTDQSQQAGIQAYIDNGDGLAKLQLNGLAIFNGTPFDGKFSGLTDLPVALGGSFLEGGIAMYGVLDKANPTAAYAAMTLDPGNNVGANPSLNLQVYRSDIAKSAALDIFIGEETWFSVTADHFTINGVELAAPITYDQSLNQADDVTFHQISSSTGFYGASFNGDGSGLTNLHTTKYLAQYMSDLGSTGTSESDLYSKTLDVNALASDGDKIDAKFAGIFANSTSTKRIIIYFAGQAIFDSGALTITAASSWEAEIFIIRVNSSTVRCSSKLITSGAALAASANYAELTGLDFTGAIVFKLTGTSAGVGSSDNDIVAKLGSVELTPI